MIEAVHSALANSSVLRPQDGGTNASAQNSSVAASSDSEISVPKAPYISPHIEVDLNYDKAVLQVRDSETGDVVRQFPSETRLQELRRQAAESQKPAVPSEDVTDTSASSETIDTGSASISASATSSSDTEAITQAQDVAATLSSAAPSSSSSTNLSSSGVSFLA